MDPAHLQLFGTEATTRELRDWWKERKLAKPPRALLPETARQLGARHQPLAIVLDSEGRVTWVKQGYVPGDEVEWGRQLARVGARSAEGHTRAGWTRRRAGSITSRANGTRPSPG